MSVQPIMEIVHKFVRIEMEASSVPAQVDMHLIQTTVHVLTSMNV